MQVKYLKRFRLFWDGEPEFRTETFGAFHAGSAAVKLNNMFYDGKAEAGPSHFAGTRFVDAVEPLEDTGDVF